MIKDYSSTLEFDKFYLIFKDDYFNKGDILSYSQGEAIVLKTYRRTWLRRFLVFLGFKIRINTPEHCIYKVKLLKWTMKKYKIELTEKQLSVIQEACEFMSRFSAGQLDYFPNSLDNYLLKKWGIDEYCKRRTSWEDFFFRAKMCMFDLSPNASLGIGNTELTEEAKICYDIYRPILELQDKEQKERDPEHYYSNVYSHPGLSYSEEGRITIETIE